MTMDSARKPATQLNAHKALKPAIGKTVLERLHQVAELSQRGRLIQRMAGHGRHAGRTR